MFHELLIALNGLPGNIFFDSPDGITISSCIPNLHPAEKEILPRLCDLGTKYKFLCDFVKKYKFQSTVDDNKIHGLYLQSFCCGLEIVLSDYQEELVQIEQELLKDPFLPLTHFLKLERHTLLFQVLYDIVWKITKEHVHGCRILELLFNHSSSGVSLVEVAMNKLMQHCHTVMYRQVFCWMINGYIEDPYDEFFIQPENSSMSRPPFSTIQNVYERNSVPEIRPTCVESLSESSKNLNGSLLELAKLIGSKGFVHMSFKDIQNLSLEEINKLSGNDFKKTGNVSKDLSKAKLETGWSSIGLFCDIPHPLQILITPSVIDKYNMIFRFLLSVRKVQMELHQSWALQMQIKGAGANSRLMPFWKLRSHMSFLIDNFQYYILVDVLESCFSNLIDKLETVKDFEEIQQSHDRFLSSVISQCFLELWTVHHSLEEILEVCSSFCSLVNRITINMNPKDLNMFENIRMSFQRQTSLLFRILSGVRSHQVSPHLSQLLLRIDYNKYLTSSGGQLGGK
ncbi:gamma-tubulin complex component 4 [Trichonephila inaurata madagascariensis]|uniref:Gamma-tubulin complex component n=1 Tax=Trichonephila inaurata madagascariensis TaxID=2747483 RepID=A0A8X6IF54_9ARAC|nr:gamma-tubulin complex component 4 [Trichonephila inaurata madagascariensis]